MRWGTMVWISGVLLVATSALHVAMEHDPLTDQTSHGQPGLETSKKQYIDVTMAPEIIDPDRRGYLIDDYVDDDEEEEDEEEEGENESGTTEGIGSGDDPDGDGSTDDTLLPEDDGGYQTTNSPPETESGDHTVVETSTGSVRGHVWRGNPNIISYIDIKYGIFNRFEAPVFPEPAVDAIHYEKVHNKRCPQLQGDKNVGVADCLTLSIFKPAKAELSGASVLVHIHEGNFINESADPEIYGPEYLVSQEIILILPNYRLGPLGFLCLQDDEAPGNAALKDLTLALKWIKINIEKFGGDPENIAVSGEGTAGALVGYLALSPMSKSYINKVITESGSVLAHWAIDRNPIAAATILKDSITGSLQEVDMEDLLLAAKNIVWRPCLESNTTDNGVHFMVETPWTMLQEEDIKITFMIGSAKYAGVHEALSHTEASIQQLNTNFSLLLPNDLQFETNDERIKVGNKVKALYFGEDTICLDNVKNRSLYYTDMAYLGPGIRTARSLVNSGATVHFYEFSFVGDLNRELVAVENQVDGAVRGDIIGYLFYQEGSMPAEGTKENDMIEQLVKFWTSFLQTGTPKTDDIEWNKFEKATAAREQWLSIDTEETILQTGLYVDRLGLWTDIYNEHFIDSNRAIGVSPGVYTVLVLQVVFFISFFRTAWHFF